MGCDEPNPRLTIRLFGGMAIRDAAGVDYLPRSRKTRAIVAVLTLTAPKSSLRSHITALLWSRRGTEQGRASLRQAVHELQNVLGSWKRMLHADRHTLAFSLANVAVDALEAAGEAAGKTALLRLFEAGFLEELHGLDPAFDAWLSKERRRLVALAQIGGEAVLEEPHSREEIILTARSLLRLDPANDAAWRALIEAHIQASDRAAARFACEQWAEAMGLGAAEVPPPDMAAFLSRIRFGSDHLRSGHRRIGVMEDVQLPEGPPSHGPGDAGIAPDAGVPPGRVAGGSVPERGVSDQDPEQTVAPDPATRGRAAPFRLMPGGATRDRVSDKDPPNRVAEPTIVPGRNGAAPDRPVPDVAAPAWAMPRREMPDGWSSGVDPPPRCHGEPDAPRPSSSGLAEDNRRIRSDRRTHRGSGDQSSDEFPQTWS